MKIEVVIPVAQYDLAIALLEMIEANTRPPDRVLIVNNTNKTHLWMIPNNFEIDYFYTKTGRLNESWEVARAQLQPDTDFVTFLNDDIIIGDWFFQRVIETFKANKDVGIVIPNGVDTPEEVKKGKIEYFEAEPKIIEAAAFTIRKEVLDKIPPVPWKRITTFYGDNWVWAYTKNMGHRIMKDLGNTMHHYVGVTVKERGYRSLKRTEFNEWGRIKKEIWNI